MNRNALCVQVAKNSSKITCIIQYHRLSGLRLTTLEKNPENVESNVSPNDIFFCRLVHSAAAYVVTTNPSLGGYK